jgi:hypothetical protein
MMMQKFYMLKIRHKNDQTIWFLSCSCGSQSESFFYVRGVHTTLAFSIYHHYYIVGSLNTLKGKQSKGMSLSSGLYKHYKLKITYGDDNCIVNPTWQLEEEEYMSRSWFILQSQSP